MVPSIKDARLMGTKYADGDGKELMSWLKRELV